MEAICGQSCFDTQVDSESNATYLRVKTLRGDSESNTDVISGLVF
jgi:hypothetical protein